MNRAGVDNFTSYFVLYSYDTTWDNAFWDDSVKIRVEIAIAMDARSQVTENLGGVRDFVVKQRDVDGPKGFCLVLEFNNIRILVLYGISKIFWMVNWCLSGFLDGAQTNEKIKRTNTCGL